MQVSFRVARKVEIDDHIDSLDVDSASQKIRANKVAAMALAKFMENPVAMMLGHFRVDIVARIAKFGYFFGQQFNALSGIAEND